MKFSPWRTRFVPAHLRRYSKVTGAGIADFAGFAEEIVERIQFATQEVKSFGERIDALQHLISHARTGSDNLGQHDGSIPAIVADLSRNANAIQNQRGTLADLATQVTGLAMKSRAGWPAPCHRCRLAM